MESILVGYVHETIASKEDIKAVQEEVTALRLEMNTGFERIENLLLAEQKRKLALQEQAPENLR